MITIQHLGWIKQQLLSNKSKKMIVAATNDQFPLTYRKHLYTECCDVVFLQLPIVF